MSGVVARAPASRLRWKPAVLALGGVAVLAGIGWVGQEWWRHGRFIESTDDAYVGGDVTALSARVPGLIEAVLVQDNQLVHAGDVLVRLDRRDYLAAEERAEATVAARMATLGSLRAQVDEQQATIGQLDAELSAKMAQAAFAVQDAGRYRDLAQTSAGSRQEAQRSASSDRQARATVAAGTAALSAGRHRLSVLEANIAEARAQVVSAEADLKTARLNLGWTDIRSPVDGYVGNRAARVGAYLAGGSYVVSVVPASGLWVDANFKEDQVGQIRAGRVVTVVADVLPGHVFRGHVASLAPGTGGVFSVIPAENATGNFTKIVQRVPVRVLLDAGDELLGVLRPGLSTTVSVDVRP